MDTCPHLACLTPARLDILIRLRQRPMLLQELLREVDLGRTALLANLSVLRAVGLVQARTRLDRQLVLTFGVGQWRRLRADVDRLQPFAPHQGSKSGQTEPRSTPRSKLT